MYRFWAWQRHCCESLCYFLLFGRISRCAGEMLRRLRVDPRKRKRRFHHPPAQPSGRARPQSLGHALRDATRVTRDPVCTSKESPRAAKDPPGKVARTIPGSQRSPKGSLWTPLDFSRIPHGSPRTSQGRPKASPRTAMYLPEGSGRPWGCPVGHHMA